VSKLDDPPVKSLAGGVNRYGLERQNLVFDDPNADGYH